MADYEAPIVNGQVQPSAAAATLMLENQAITSRALLLSDNGGYVDLPLVGGSVTADSGSVTRRTASLSIRGEWTDDPTSRLTPYGARVRVQRGIQVATDTVEWMTLMTGRITEVDQASDRVVGEMKLTLKDDFFTLSADRFDAATSTDTTVPAVTAITNYILQTIPTATVIDLTGSTTLTGKADLQQDRAGGVDKIATAIAAECYCGRDGTFIIRPQPTLDDTPGWQVTVGEHGNMITVDRKRTTDKTYNRVLAKGETNQTTGTAVPPVYADAKIDDPSDPLYYGGPFGRVTRFYTSSLLTTTDQCAATAAALLERARGRNYDISFTALVNPALDPGDVIHSQLSDGVIRTHIVDSVTYPLGRGDAQSISTRSLELPDENQLTAA